MLHYDKVKNALSLSPGRVFETEKKKSARKVEFPSDLMPRTLAIVQPSFNVELRKRTEIWVTDLQLCGVQIKRRHDMHAAC